MARLLIKHTFKYCNHIPQCRKTGSCVTLTGLLEHNVYHQLVYSYEQQEMPQIFYRSDPFLFDHCFDFGHQQHVLPVECRAIFTPSDPDTKESSGLKRQTVPAVGVGRLSESYSRPPAEHRPAPATRLSTCSSCRGAAHLS